MAKAVFPGLRVASLIGAVLSFQASAWAEPPPAALAPASSPAAGAPNAKPAAKAAVKPSAARSAEKERLDAALKKLSAGDPALVQSAIDTLVEQGGAVAERALTERVAAGLPPSLVEPALQALVKLHAKRSVPVLVELLAHRRALVRSEALRALSQLDTRKPSPLQATFVSALDDSASEVKRAAAEGLGRIGTRSALPALWTAYDAGVTPALASIAELAGPESVDAVMARAQAGGLGMLETVLDRMVERKALPNATQVKVVRGLAALKTEDSRQFLLKWLDRVKMQNQTQLKKELFEALKAFNTAPAAPAAASEEVALKSGKAGGK